MKRLHLQILALVGCMALLGLSSCMLNCVHGSGDMKTETRKVSDFNRISISGVYKVVLKQDSSRSVTITADDNLLKYIKTNVSGGRLKIYNRRNFCNTGELTVNIGVRNLEELSSSGVVEVESDGKINTKDMRFKLSGASKITMDLNAANVVTSGEGASELNLKGQATSHDIDLSGDSKVYALDFVVSSCEIESTGVGHCEVNVLNSLSVHSSGASEVKYRGNPSNVTNDKSGASSIEKVD
jgi:hypothetical protein